MDRTAIPGRRHIDFAWICLGISDELRHGSRWDGWIEYHDIWHAEKTADWSEVAGEIVRKLLVERRFDCSPGTHHQQGLPVRKGLRDCIHGYVGTSAWPFLHEELLTEPF